MDGPIKALLIAIADDAPAAVYSINRLKPDLLCFFGPASVKQLIETAVQPHIAQMPRRWDCVITSDASHFAASCQALSRTLPDLLQTWEVKTGDLVMDMTGATPAMAVAMMLTATPYCSRIVSLGSRTAADSQDAE